MDAENVSTPAPQFEGRVVHFGGKDWIAPPLTLGPIKRLTPVLKRLTATDAATDPMAQLGDVVQLVHASLVRNYPSLTVEQLEDLIELPALAAVVQAVLEVSGFASAATGDTSGNAVAGQG